MSAVVEKKSLKQVAQQALREYQQDADYLPRQTPQQLQRIKRAAVSQIAKKVPQADQYKGLLDNVNDQIAFRQKKKTEADAEAKWKVQLRKAASQITWKHWLWTIVISAVITGISGVIAKVITESWPWYGYFLLGIVLLTLLGIGSLIAYNCRCGRKLEDQEVKRLQQESKVNVNE